MAATQITSYTDLAEEYYERDRHPTSSNFRDGSRTLLKSWLFDSFLSQHLPVGFHGTEISICEVGAGDSLVAEILADEGYPLCPLLITDASPEMLEYSEAWEEQGAKIQVASAESLPLPSSSINLWVSVLGDPYNNINFWREASRVLREDGWMIYTTPSFEWASLFRDQVGSPGFNFAEFTLRGGETASVPSIIFSRGEQEELITSVGLSVLDFKNVRLKDLPSDYISPKLQVDSENLPVVAGYLIQNRSGA